MPPICWARFLFLFSPSDSAPNVHEHAIENDITEHHVKKLEGPVFLLEALSRTKYNIRFVESCTDGVPKRQLRHSISLSSEMRIPALVMMRLFIFSEHQSLKFWTTKPSSIKFFQNWPPPMLFQLPGHTSVVCTSKQIQKSSKGILNHSQK